MGFDEGRVDASALERAFPLPRISRDTVTLVLFAAVALVLRVITLGDRALHHDESLHATYSWYLMGRANPEYHYDPMMHGPLQFHMIGLFYSFLGSSPFAARMWSVAAGTALVIAPWILRRQLGRLGTYALMAIFCFSPITLYISRFAREDMQFGLFSFLMVASLVRFVADHEEGAPGYFRWLYVLASSFILAYAAKESIYLTTAALGSFLAIELAIELAGTIWWVGLGAGTLIALGGVLGHHLALAALGACVVLGVLVAQLGLSERTGLLAGAIRAVPARIWGLSAAIIVVLFVLFYWPIGQGDSASWGFVPGAHTVNTTLDIPGKAKPEPFTYSTDGLFGGLQYWQAQEPVARGGQPWYYYAFLLPLYEWTVVLFGLLGAWYVLARKRTFFTLLALWWTGVTFVIYAWASEKMPWNALHLVIPLAVLAAIGLPPAVTHAKRWARTLAIAALAITGLVSLHNSFTLSYVNGADPVELMVYVQTNQDVPAVYNELQRIQAHSGGPLHLMVDTEDEWPWVFYLRDTGRFFTDKYPSTTTDYSGATQPALLVGAANYNALSGSLGQRYVAFREVLRWWGPEEYKTYAERTYPYKYDAKGQLVPPSGKPLPRIERLGNFVRDVLTPSTWGNVLRWEIQRRPFTPTAWQGDNNQLIFYFLVRKDMVPYLSPAMQAQAAQQVRQQQLQDPFYSKTRAVAPVASFGGASGVAVNSAGPLAVDANGDTFVVDVNGGRVLEYTPNGTLSRSWGSAGSAKGQFHFQYQLGGQGGQTSGIAVDRAGDVYVSDTWNHRIQVFSPTGAFLRSWGQATAHPNRPQPGEFYGPRGVAVAANGNVYVADTGNRRVQVFTPEGRFLFAFGGLGAAMGQLNEPSSLAFDHGGNLYVADYWNQRVQIFDARGRSIGSFPVGIWQANSYDEPAIAVDGAGRVYVPDPGGQRILVYTASGRPYAALTGAAGAGQGLTRPQSVAVGSDGRILVSDMGAQKVLQFAAP